MNEFVFQIPRIFTGLYTFLEGIVVYFCILFVGVILILY